MHIKHPVVHVGSLVDYGNKKITGAHLYTRRQNVAAQVVEELKTFTYATPLLWRNAKQKKKITVSVVCSPV